MLKYCFVIVFLLSLSACAGAPVQEMSNARQAVAAAEQGGAAKSAPQQLKLARNLLQAAQAALDKGEYSTAREDALHARDAAVKALRISQGLDTPDQSPP